VPPDLGLTRLEPAMGGPAVLRMKSTSMIPSHLSGCGAQATAKVARAHSCGRGKTDFIAGYRSASLRQRQAPAQHFELSIFFN
jgi:hypothetical protein